MKKHILRAVTLMLTVFLLLSTMFACGKKDDSNKITVLLVENFTRLGEDQSTPVTKALEEKFGKTFEFITGSTHDEVSAKLGQLVNANRVPDLVIGQTIDLNNYAKAFLNYKNYESKMPNMFKYINEPEVTKLVTLTDGRIINTPTIVELQIQVAYLIRTDWLDNLGMDIPETFEEFEEVMYAFKNDDPDMDGVNNTIGFAQAGNNWELQFANNFKGSCENILRDGKLVYGPTEPQYKETLMYLNRLYKDGVLNPEFATCDIDKIQQLVSSGQVGFTRAFFNRLEDIIIWSQASDPNAEWAIILPPILDDGKRYEQYQTNRVGNFGIAINKNTSKKDLLIELVDYLYSEEGKLLTQFGVEGVTYEMVDGKPKFLSNVTNNPKWKDSRSVKSYYGIEPQTHFAMVQNKESFIFRQEVMDGIALCEANSEMYDHIIQTPPTQLNMAYTEDEAQAVLVDWYEMNSRCEEQSYKFIMGQRSFNEWDKFMNELKSLGLENSMKVINEAYARIKD